MRIRTIFKRSNKTTNHGKEQKYFINEIFFCKYVIKEKNIFKLTQSMKKGCKNKR